VPGHSHASGYGFGDVRLGRQANLGPKGQSANPFPEYRSTDDGFVRAGLFHLVTECTKA